MTSAADDKLDSPPDGHSDEGLEKGALGLLGATLMGVVIMAPSLALYANWGPMVPLIGTHGALIFLIALVMTLPTAYSYSVLSARVPNAGSVFAWASRFLHPRAGALSGYCAVIFYVMLAAFEPPLIASITLDLIGSKSTALFIVVLFAVLALVLPVAWAGIALSMGTAAVLVAIEGVIVVIVIVAAFFTVHGAQLSLEPLNPSGIPSTTLLLQALVLGILSFTGFDAVSTVAEETRTAKTLIPRATLLSAIATGIFWIVTTFLLSNAVPVQSYLDSKDTPLTFAATSSMGSFGRVLVDLMALEAGLAITLASVVGASRVVFAMGRDRYLPTRFAAVDDKRRTPRHAITLVVAIAALANVAVGCYLGWNVNIYLWLANCIVFFGLIVYMFVNATHVVYFLKFERAEFRVLPNLIVPVIGFLIAVYYLYSAFFVALWNADFQLGRSTVIAAVVAFLLMAVAAAVVRVRPPAAIESV
jgi:putrescine importer